MLKETDRLALIQRVLNKAYEETESWHDDHVGSSLAYLCLAIADGKPDSWVDWSGDHPHVVAVRELFHQWFKPGDPVFDFIREIS